MFAQALGDQYNCQQDKSDLPEIGFECDLCLIDGSISLKMAT